MTISFNILKRDLTLSLIFSIGFIFSTISCGCNDGPTQGNHIGRLTFAVAPLHLSETKPNTTVTFQLAEAGKKVNLEKFQLKASIIEQKGGSGSQLKYHNAKGEKEVEEKLSRQLNHFVTLNDFEHNNGTLKVDFKLKPNKEVDLLIYRFEAFDSTGNLIDSYDVRYELDKTLPILSLKSSANLQGNEKEIKLNIHNPSSKIVGAGTLKLRITRIQGGKAVIVGSKPTDIANTYEIEIGEVPAGTKNLAQNLTIDSKTDSKAAFEIQLICQGEIQEKPISVSWQQSNLQIQGLTPFVGDNEASFILCNNVAAIDPREFIIEITSDNAVDFAFIKQDGNLLKAKKAILLDKLIGSVLIPVNKNTVPIRFKLVNPNGKDESQVTIRIKRADEEVTSQMTTWKAQGVSLKMEASSHTFKDQDKINITLKNIGDIVNTNKIRLVLSNNQDVAFKIENLPASTAINTTLKTIIGKEQLGAKKSLSFSLQKDPILAPDIYSADLTVELFDEANFSLHKIALTWVNQTKIGTVLNPLKNKLNELVKNYNQEITNSEIALSLKGLGVKSDYDAWSKSIKEIIGIEKELKSLLQMIDLSKMDHELQQSTKSGIGFLVNETLKSANWKIMGAIEIAKNGVDHYAGQAEDASQKLNVGDTDINLRSLDEALYDMNKMLGYANDIAGAYGIKEGKDIAQEAKEIAVNVEKLVKETKEQAVKKKANKDAKPTGENNPALNNLSC
ncbi:hypothetical protein Aasi_1487 [Candidatus Amoebophilus asiaticus 5a2]|uniref:Uncharacterized protein n=1 Tax=Amoebophilus asiaticus (strain 5a2) TaxID=452471 RepID=C3L4D7_AMOA5|nr:hypothetical protein [Candidatus Amoebophilus asiaticus]ACP20854.1 hypothetical protein Aasi_1487 [Candidatus Amoebophilus asiaticus 5a2]